MLRARLTSGGVVQVSESRLTDYDPLSADGRIKLSGPVHGCGWLYKGLSGAWGTWPAIRGDIDPRVRIEGPCERSYLSFHKKPVRPEKSPEATLVSIPKQQVFVTPDPSVVETLSSTINSGFDIFLRHMIVGALSWHGLDRRDPTAWMNETGGCRFPL